MQYKWSVCIFNSWRVKKNKKKHCILGKSRHIADDICYAPVSLCRIYCWKRTNWRFEFVWVIIPGHSSNDNDNDNQFEKCSAHACSFGRSVWKFWTCSKISCTQHEYLCALKMCSYLLCRTAYVVYSSHFYCIPGCSNCTLCQSSMGKTRR